MTTRLATVSRLLLALMLALAGAWGGSQSPAPAAEPEGQVRVELTSVTPLALTSGGTVTIKGRVTNTSSKPMRQVQVALWRELAPVHDAADFERLLHSAWDDPEGERMVNPESAYFTITSDKRPTLAPKATAEFTVSAPVDELRLSSPGPGKVYLLGVHVRAIPHGDRNQTVGRSRVFMPMPGPRTTAKISPIVQLSSAPSLAVDGTFTDDHLAGELGGRLETLLRAAELPGATVLVDPALIDEVTAMTDGYQVGNDKVPDTDARAQRASAWLARFHVLRSTGATRGGAIYRLPYGNPDLENAASLNRVEVRTRALAALPKNHELAPLPLAIWPNSGAFTPTLRKFVAPMKPRVLLEPSGNPGVFAPDTATTLLRYDTSIVDGGPGPDPSGTEAQRTGRLLSQLLVQETPSLLAVRTAAEAASLLDLPAWVTTVGTGDIATTLRAPQPTIPTPARGLALPFDLINSEHRLLLDWHDLLGTEGGGHLVADQMASRAANPALSASGRRQAWLTRATASVPPSLHQGQLKVTIARSIVMGARTTSLPATITNNSPVPVRLRVQMVSDNPQRLTIPDTELITIPPNSSRSVQFTPKATGNGVVEFTALLTTEAGRTVGQPTRFSVNATNFGQVGWMIIIASGVVVLGGTAMRIKQVQRERAKAPAADVAATPHPDITARPHP